MRLLNKNPSEAVQFAAVKEDGEAIKYIIDKGIVPSEKVQIAAVEQSEVQLAAVKQNGGLLNI